MQSRYRNKIDADSCIMEALYTEARTLAQINLEENEEKLRELPSPCYERHYSQPHGQQHGLLNSQ